MICSLPSAICCRSRSSAWSKWSMIFAVIPSTLIFTSLLASLRT